MYEQRIKIGCALKNVSRKYSSSVIPGNKAARHWEPVHALVSQQVLPGGFLLSSRTGVVESNAGGHCQYGSEHQIIGPLESEVLHISPAKSPHNIYRATAQVLLLVRDNVIRKEVNLPFRR